MTEDTILDWIDCPREGQHVAVLTKHGDVVAGVYCGTIPRKHDSYREWDRDDRWIVAEDADNVVHIPTTWIRNAVVETRC